MKKQILILMVLSLLILSCGTIREHRKLSQPQEQPLTASVGSTLFRLAKQEDLPNAFGGRDIYGGKVDKGFAEVKLRGIREGGVLELLVFDVNRESSETTMDRYRPLARVDVSQTVNLTGGDGGVSVSIDSKAEREYVLAGIKITFLEVRPSSLVYTITDLHLPKH